MIEHYDKFKRLIKVGDCIAFANHNTIECGIVKKLTAKMVRFSLIGRTSLHFRYPNDMIVIDGPEITMYILKQKT